jgi:hypothetical protein
MLEDLCVALNTTRAWLLTGNHPIEPVTTAEAVERLKDDRKNLAMLKKLDDLFPVIPSDNIDPKLEIAEIVTYCRSLLNLADPSPRSVGMFALAIEHCAIRLGKYFENRSKK